MKAAFFHDHRFARDAAGVHYANGGLPESVFARYLEHFTDGLVVVGRAQPAAAGARPKPAESPMSRGGVEIACIEQLCWVDAFMTREVERVVKGALARASCAIVRLPSILGLVAAREAARAGMPWMAEVVGCAWSALWNYGSTSMKLAAGPVYLLSRWCVGRAPRVLYVTREFLQRRYPTHGTAIGCSDVQLPPRSRETLERRLSRIHAAPRDGKLVVGLVGLMDVEFKGHETAIRALGLLRDERPRIVLRLLGGGRPGRWMSLAKRLGVEDRIELSGVLPNGAPVIEWMDQLDVFISPSLTEGLPRALTEAMSRALPALGSRVGGIPELLASDDLHDPGDHRGLARLLRTLAVSPEARRERAVRNFEKSREYDSEVLDRRRRDFLAEFADDVRRSVRCRAGAEPLTQQRQGASRDRVLLTRDSGRRRGE